MSMAMVITMDERSSTLATRTRPGRRARSPHGAKRNAGCDVQRGEPPGLRFAPSGLQGDSTSGAALYRLMAWLSPAYPVGAFSYSSGLEWAVETGDVRDAETLRGWLEV